MSEERRSQHWEKQQQTSSRDQPWQSQNAMLCPTGWDRCTHAEPPPSQCPLFAAHIIRSCRTIGRPPEPFSVPPSVERHPSNRPVRPRGGRLGPTSPEARARPRRAWRLSGLGDMAREILGKSHPTARGRKHDTEEHSSAQLYEPHLPSPPKPTPCTSMGTADYINRPAGTRIARTTLVAAAATISLHRDRVD